MDENDRAYSLKAPGSPGSSSPLRLPGRGPLPGVDDRLVEPEVTRDEIIGGRRVVAMPAEKPHSTQQGLLYSVLQYHLAPGYVGGVEMLTRQDVDSDFAADACLLKDGIDPATGARYLEELAFEVVSKQATRSVSEKAERMHGRGVRRIFAVFIRGEKRVCEWSPGSRSWRLLDSGSSIEDRCFMKSLPVAALLDAALAANAVAKALIIQGNPEIRKLEIAVRREGEAKGRAEGRVEGQVEFILKLLEARGVAVSEAQRQVILSCRDLARLGRWLVRAALASSADEVLSEP
ncbi:MAG TPA: hypothetical protein VFC23_21265 [Thermoanaerobaculia bacterium]|nr:hypothetical protein [Thermoanaerobaculia bacterium]